MGDQPTTNGASGTNGTATAPNGLDLARMRDKGRAAFLSAVSGGEVDSTKPAEPDKPVTAITTLKGDKPAVEAKKPSAPVDDFADDDDAEEPDDFAEPDDKTHDADTRRRLDKLQRQEAHGREQLARERAELEREKAALAADRDKAKPRSKYEAIEMLEEMGFDEDEWGLLAKRAHARSKDGKSDPKWRDTVDREATAKRDRDDVKSLKQEIADLKKSAADREQSERTERELSRYFDAAKKLASDDSPLFKRHLTADPDEAHADLAAIAHEGMQKTGKLIPQKKLIEIYERRRARFLAKFGVDVDALLGKKTTKEQTMAAAKEHAATTTDTTTATSATGAGAHDRKSQRATFLSSSEAD